MSLPTALLGVQMCFYFLIASHDRNFSDTDNQVTYTDFWVSDLALVVRPHDHNIEGFVLEANSGEPVGGGGQDLRPGDYTDPPVTEPEELGAGQVPALLVGRNDGVPGMSVPADHRDPATAALENPTGMTLIILGVSVLCLAVCIHVLHVSG